MSRFKEFYYKRIDRWWPVACGLIVLVGHTVSMALPRENPLVMAFRIAMAFAVGGLCFKWFMWKDKAQFEQKLRKMADEHIDHMHNILNQALAPSVRPNKFIKPDPKDLYAKL